MSEKRYLGEDERAIDMPRPMAVPGRAPVSAKLFPGALMRKARDANGVAPGAEDAVARASSSSGAALPADVRGRFESSLGADLSAVRVHTGADSADAASSVGARAYAVGNDIHFGAGQYAPSDPFGLHLLAHEVAHTQQQAGGAARTQYKLEVSSPGDAAEVEADRAADAMVSGASFAVGGHAAGIRRKEEESESGGASASFTLGDDTTQASVSKDGKKGGISHTKEFEIFNLGPYPVCPEPPLFASVSFSAKVTAAASTQEDDKGNTESDTIGGSLALEVSGKLLMGAAKKGLGKVGLEGALTASIALPVSVTLTKDGELKLPGDIIAPIMVEATIALVGEVGEGHKKVGGALTKNLSSLKAGTVTINDSGVHFEPCSLDALAQAGKDLLWNLAETVLPGGAAIQQYEQDKKNQEIFDKNTEEQDKEAEKMMHDTDNGPEPTFRGPAVSGYAERETDIHEKYNQQLAGAKAECDRAAGPFNGARDQSWWQNGAYGTWNQGAVHRMNAEKAYAKYKTAEGTDAVKPLAETALSEFQQASKAFYDAQDQQFGKRVSS